MRTEVVKETDGPLIPEGDDAPPPGDEPPPGMEPSTDKVLLSSIATHFKLVCFGEKVATPKRAQFTSKHANQNLFPDNQEYKSDLFIKVFYARTLRGGGAYRFALVLLSENFGHPWPMLMIE